MSGFGRGGRGAALLKALQEPVRQPELPLAESPQPLTSTFYPQASLPSTSAQGPPILNPRGRGLTKLVLPPPDFPQTASAISNVPGAASMGGASPPGTVPFEAMTPSPVPNGGLRKTDKDVPVKLGRGMLLQAMQQQQQQQQPLPGAHTTTPSPTNRPRVVGADASPPTRALREMDINGKPSTIGRSSSSSPTTPTHRASVPKQRGSAGSKIPLGANYIPLRSRIEGVFQYAVSYSPPVESRSLRYAMLNEHRDVIGATKAFDGSTLFLPEKITDSSLSVSSVRRTDGTNVTITIALTNILAYTDCIQLFNIIIRRVLRALNMNQVGRYYFDQSNPIKVTQHMIELWPGYVTAVHQFDGGLLLMVDVSHRLVRMDSALDFLYELYKSHRNQFQDEALRQLVGTVVLTRYNNKTYRVDDIAWDKNPQSTFIDHTGKAICFIDYYKNAYGCEIHDVDQPLLLHRPRKNRMGGRPKGESPEEERESIICLVPELCSMTGLTDAARNDFKVMKDLAVHTRVTPNQREVSIRKFVKLVSTNPKASQELSSWGLSLHPGILETEGRRLPPEKILFQKNVVTPNLEADWGRDVVREHVISAVPIRNWMLIFVKKDQSKAMDFFTMLKKVSPPMGIEVRDPVVVEISNDRTETYVRSIREQINPSLQLVVIIFPTARNDRYSSVKKLCCVENPVPSQVINARTISHQQKLRSVTQKIALQINAKLGGELWAVEIPLKNLMVIGIDVYHDASQGKRSILGFVSSTNRHLTCWYSRVSIQDQHQEIADGLRMCLQASLRKYHEMNHSLPERVIVFRDGVGDGQMSVVADFEVPQFRSCFTMFGENYKPRLAVVVVQKRISTRLFAKGQGGYENPAPGTVMDHSITRKGWYDFFLVSQHVRQGTVTPTHYNVVVDDSGLQADHMQRLAYKLTHMYYNWPGTVRVPAPCQYAHKLAFLVGQSLHKDPSLDLADRLFFL